MGFIEYILCFFWKLEMVYGFHLVRDKLRMKIGDGPEESGFVFQEVDKEGCLFSSTSLDVETNQRRRDNVYRQILQSFDELQVRSKGLEEAKSKILRYSFQAQVHMFSYNLCLLIVCFVVTMWLTELEKTLP